MRRFERRWGRLVVFFVVVVVVKRRASAIFARVAGRSQLAVVVYSKR